MYTSRPVRPSVMTQRQGAANTEIRVRRRSGTLVLVVPDFRLPKLDLVFVRVHDPRKLAVLVRLGSLDGFHTPRTQLLQQLGEVVDPVVDHEGRLAWAEPLAVFPRDMPHSQAFILGLVVRPSEDSAAKVFQREAQVLPIPCGQRGAVAPALEEDAAHSGDSRHRCSPRCLVAPHCVELRAGPPGDARLVSFSAFLGSGRFSSRRLLSYLQGKSGNAVWTTTSHSDGAPPWIPARCAEGHFVISGRYRQLESTLSVGRGVLHRLGVPLAGIDDDSW